MRFCGRILIRYFNRAVVVQRAKYMGIDFLYIIEDIGRHNLVLVRYNANSLNVTINRIRDAGISSVNIGKELSEKLQFIESSKYLAIEAQEYLHELIEKHAVQIASGKPKVVAIYNIGILLEPALSLNVANLLKDFSKNMIIIVLWDHIYAEGQLHWGVQQDKYRLNLSDIYIAEGSADYGI